MKIVIASDKYKGSLSALEVCRIIGRTIKETGPDIEVILSPMADGGDLLLRGKRVGTAESVAIEICCRLSGCTQREVARHFAYGSESAVGKQRQMLAARLEKDPSLSRHLKQLTRRLCL